MPEILRFEPNIPVQLALKCTETFLIEGRWGDQVQYSLSDGRMMFLPPDVSKQLNLLDLRPSEPFFICKRKVGRRNVWDLWLAPDAEKSRASKETAAEPRSDRDLETQLRKSIEQIPRKPAAIEAGGCNDVPGFTIGHGATGTYGPQPLLAVASRPTKQQYGDAMAEFLVLAGRAARKAETILGKEEGSVRFDSRDIAAFATTCFIAAENRGLLTWSPEGPK